MNAFVNLKLAACGAPPLTVKSKEQNFLTLVDPILKSYQEQQHLLIDQGAALCPADQRVQDFLNSFLADTGEPVPQLPARQMKLDRHGILLILHVFPYLWNITYVQLFEIFRAVLFQLNMIVLLFRYTGLAKLLSLPRGEDMFQNEIITSYRVSQVRKSLGNSHK